MKRSALKTSCLYIWEHTHTQEEKEATNLRESKEGNTWEKLKGGEEKREMIFFGSKIKIRIKILETLIVA